MELIRNSPNNSTFSKIYVIVSRMERSVWWKRIPFTPNSCEFQRDAIDSVYKMILRKWFTLDLLRRWKEERCQKHEVAFRSKLKAGVNTKKSEQPKRPAPDKPDESSFVKCVLLHYYVTPAITINEDISIMPTMPSCSILREWVNIIVDVGSAVLLDFDQRQQWCRW